MNVDALEASESKRSRHLDVTVDALLTKNRHAGLVGVLSWSWRVGIKGQLVGQPGIRLVETVVVFLAGRHRIVAKRLHAVGRLAPRAADESEVGLERKTLADKHLESARGARDRACDRRRNASRLEHGENVGDVLFRDLQDGARLLVEKLFERIAVGKLRDYAASAGDRHFRERNRDAAVRAVVVGKRLLRLDNLLHRVEETLEENRIGIGVGVAKLSVDLSERSRAKRRLALRKIDVDEEGRLPFWIGLEIGRQRKTDVLHGREGAHDERERRDLLSRRAVGLVPDGVHRAGVLADRNRHAHLRAEVQANFLDGIVENRIFARLAAGSHPVRGKADLRDVADIGGSEVRNRLGNRHAARRGAVKKRDGRTLASRHRLAFVSLVAHRRDGAVSGGKLVATDHLVARNTSSDRTVGDRDEERLVRDGREMENALKGVKRLHTLEVRASVLLRDALHLADHAGRLAEQDLDVHVDRRVTEVRVLEDELSVASSDADESDRAALAAAEFLEEKPRLGAKRKNIALLCLAAPDLHRVHRHLFVVDLAELELAASRLDELGAAV